MIRKTFTIAITAILSFSMANAQFLINTKEGTKHNVEGNIKFTPSQDSWSIDGISIENIESITRSMAPTELSIQAYAAYYSGIKTSSLDGSANYYFCLSDVDVDYNAEGQMLPMEPGMLMMFDMFAADSTDPDNAILPEGIYPVNDSQKSGSANVQLTFARILDESGEIIYKILDGGTIEVKHTTDGEYNITGSFITKEGEKFDVNYNGSLKFENFSQAADDTLMQQDLFDTVFKDLTITAHGGDEDYHRYTLQLFDGDITEDGVITSGIVLNIDLFSEPNTTEEIYIYDGIYNASLDYQQIEEFEPYTFLAGDCYTVLGYPLYIGTYVQDLRTATEEGFIRSGYANQGSIEVKRDGEKYNLKVDITMRNGVRLTGEYPMGKALLLDARPIEPAGPWHSTLTTDKEMVFSNETYSYAHMYPGYRDNDFNNYDNVNEFEIIVNDHVTNESFQLNVLVPSSATTPEGTFTVADVENKKYDPYTFIPGYYDFSTMRGTWPYELFETNGNYPIAEAPATEGTIEIKKNDNGTYTISFEVKDDAEPKNTIKAVWSGVINDPYNTWNE